MPQYEKEIGGRKLILGTGKLASQASGAVTCRYGDTIVLATCVMSEEAREGIDYLPLLCDYEVKFYAAGKIKTSRFLKREGRPSDEAIITSRCIDRSIRPLFPKEMVNDIQVVVTVLSFDRENDPDIPALIASSCALSISDIPFLAPQASVRVGRIGKEWVINPTLGAQERSDLNLVLSGTKDQIVMIEAQAQEIPEDTLLSAIQFGHKHIQKIIAQIEEVVRHEGKKKTTPILDKIPHPILKDVKKIPGNKIDDLLYKATKEERGITIREIRERLLKKYGDEEDLHIKKAIYDSIYERVRQNILDKELRIGGRKLDEIRPLHCEVGILPRTHGSGLFKRGETQVLTTVTLGAPGLEQILEGLEEEERKKRFMHHYCFPPYSVGEVAPMRAPSRREIGHGALVEKSLLPFIPKKEDFPYTIRLVSEVLSSNGSTSMASCCASSMALMDAGVPIKKACAGIAMGLVTDGKKNYKILSDIQDFEDFGGDMDFKVSGTRDGICALQMDTKLTGLPQEILEKAFRQARDNRLSILKEMEKVISRPRAELSSYAPVIIRVKIDPEKIRKVVGPQGKVIKEIIGQCGVEIDIEEDGQVYITSKSKEAANKAADWVRDIVKEVKVGEVLSGKVTKILAFGAIVELWPGMEGLIHISKLAPFRIRRVEDIVKVGDIVPVKVIEITEQGRISLSLVQKGSRK